MYHIFQLLQSEWEREKSPFPVDTDEWSHLCVLIQQFGAFFIVSVNFGWVALTTGLSHPKQSVLCECLNLACWPWAALNLCLIFLWRRVCGQSEAELLEGRVGREREREGSETVWRKVQVSEPYLQVQDWLSTQQARQMFPLYIYRTVKQEHTRTDTKSSTAQIQNRLW